MNEKRTKLKEKQDVFFRSIVRFPFMISAWATGKTMLAIEKGMLLSTCYKNNLGLIVRKVFTDLRDSTVKDFERYTGLFVPMSTKEVTLPNGSTIMFRHGDELSGLQNINLGWVVIEQAEEFETAEQFDMLRGRLRRELELDDTFDFNNPAIADLKDALLHGLRQLMVIGNTAGHNWIWKKVKQVLLPDYELVEMESFDNGDVLPEDYIEDLRRLEIESPKKFRRFVLNSWEDYDLEGTYYASLMSDALVQHRIKTVPYDSYAPVYTFWDLGIGDSTAIWFVQFIGSEIHLIDYYENSGESFQHYAKVLQEKPYIYKEHFAPHDAAARTLQTGVSTVEIAQQVGIKFKVIERHSIESRIEITRGVLPRCWFDEDKCKAGIEALNHYKKRRNEVLSTEEKSVYGDVPLHDWASNGADSFGYMAYAYRYEVIGGARIGTTSPTYAGLINKHDEQGVTDLLKVY